MVDFALPDDVEKLVGRVREFARGEIGPAERALDAMADPGAAFASETFATIVRRCHELGLHKLTVPAAAGGLGLGPLAHFAVLEELAAAGAGLASQLMVSPIAAIVIATFGLAAKHSWYARYLETYVEDPSGRHGSCWAITEPGIGSDAGEFDLPLTFATRARPAGGRYRVDGAKSAFVSNGARADSILLMATVDPEQGMLGTGVFLVPGDLPGIARGRPLDKLGLRALNQAELFFDGVEIDEAFLLMPPSPMYPTMLQGIVTGGNTGVGTLALGVARTAYEEGLAYAKGRRQGGKPIFEHQLIATKLFEAFRDIEAARALLWKSAWLIEQGRGDPRVAFAARSFACATCLRVTSDMVQVFGGYGISKEYVVEKLYRDAKLLQIMDGTVEKAGLGAAARL